MVLKWSYGLNIQIPVIFGNQKLSIRKDILWNQNFEASNLGKKNINHWRNLKKKVVFVAGKSVLSAGKLSNQETNYMGRVGMMERPYWKINLPRKVAGNSLELLETMLKWLQQWFLCWKVLKIWYKLVWAISESKEEQILNTKVARKLSGTGACAGAWSDLTGRDKLLGGGCKPDCWSSWLGV